MLRTTGGGPEPAFSHRLLPSPQLETLREVEAQAEVKAEEGGQ
jgi:hypothetical protein